MNKRMIFVFVGKVKNLMSLFRRNGKIFSGPVIAPKDY